MSGPIRRALALINKRIVDILELNLNEFKVEADVDKTYEENLEDFQDMVRELEMILSKLVASIKSIREKDESWLSIIQQLKDNEHKEEMQLYEDRMTPYQENLDRADMLIVAIKSKLKELNAKIKAFIKEQNRRNGSSRTSLDSSNGKKVKSPEVKVSEDVERTTDDELARENRQHFSERSEREHMLPYEDLMLGNRNSSYVTPNRNKGRNRNNIVGSKAFRMPEIHIPEFDGTLNKWNDFWQCFELAVHLNHELNKIEKFLILKKYLKGRAERVVAGYKLSDENYDYVIVVLKRRFGDSDLIRHGLLTNLDKIASATNKVDNLRTTLESVNETINQLVSLGENPNNSQTMVLVEKKFPSLSREIFRRKRSVEDWDLYDLLTYIEELILTEEVVNQYESDLNVQSHSKSIEKINKNSYSTKIISDNVREEDFITTMSLQSEPNNAPLQNMPNRIPYCVFCSTSGDHFTSECNVYKTNKERLEIINKENRCYRCLKVGHHSNKCRSERKCRRCGGPHNQAICRQREDGNKINKNSQSSSNANFVEANNNFYSSNDNNMNFVANSECNTNCSETLLMVVKVNVSNPKHPCKCVDTLLFVDEGSELSFISENLVKCLGLSRSRDGILNLNKFGNSKCNINSCEVVFDLHAMNDSLIPIEAKVVSEITGNVKYSKNPIRDLYQNNVEVVRGKPDILIGSDQIGKIFNVERLPSGFCCIPTRLGPLISGKGNTKQIANQINSVTESANLESIQVMSVVNVEESRNENTNDNDNSDLSDRTCSLDTFGSSELDAKKEKINCVSEDYVAVGEMGRSVKSSNNDYFTENVTGDHHRKNIWWIWFILIIYCLFSSFSIEYNYNESKTIISLEKQKIYILKTLKFQINPLTPFNAAGVDKLLEIFLEYTIEKYYTYKTIFEVMKGSIQRIFNSSIKVFLVGSLQQGINIVGNDRDICFLTPANYRTFCSKNNQIKLELDNLPLIRRELQHLYSNYQIVPSKNPVLRMNFNEVEIDLVNNQESLELTNISCQYTNLEEISNLCKIIKYLAIKFEVHDAMKGFINSISYSYSFF